MTEKQIINRDSWQKILAPAVSIFDDLRAAEACLPELVLGGGTPLIFRLEHLLSKVIEFFIRDAHGWP